MSTAANEVMINAGQLPWLPMIDGIDFKLLRISEETGSWTVLFRCQPGSSFPIHKHLGAGEYYVLTGRMVYRIGEAGPSTYGYEPLGVIHESTTFPEYTELLFTNHGPVAFLDDDGGVKQLLDGDYLSGLAADA